MENHPLVSIITPTYNHEEFIGQCIESVIAQTYPNWEQIIIDDGSTDRTEEIVAQYDDDRIKYVQQENIGIWRLSETYNKALRMAKGELVAVLEGDDFWPTYKLERQIPTFEMPEVVLSCGKAAVTNKAGKTLWISPGSIKKLEHATRDTMMQNLFFENFIRACTVICRKDALLSIGGFVQPPQVPYVDYPTWLELGLIGDIKPVNEILGFWRRHGRQISAEMILDMTNAHNKCVISFFKRLSSPERARFGISINELQDRCRYNIAASHLSIGRLNLIRHEWTKARENFEQALQNGTLYLQMQAFLGIICAYLKIDMEWVALLMLKPRFTETL